jgi:hypothetical protein
LPVQPVQDQAPADQPLAVRSQRGELAALLQTRSGRQPQGWPACQWPAGHRSSARRGSGVCAPCDAGCSTLAAHPWWTCGPENHAVASGVSWMADTVVSCSISIVSNARNGVLPRGGTLFPSLRERGAYQRKGGCQARQAGARGVAH